LITYEEIKKEFPDWTPLSERIVKIQNPAGRAGTFTYDKGWISVADIDSNINAVSPTSSSAA
jgi:hypothetical protein